jgi:hypothetical protein
MMMQSATYVPDVHVSVFIFGAVLRIPIIHGLQFPARWEGPHDNLQHPLSLQVPSCKERAGEDVVDGETCTAGNELPLQS